MEVKKLGKTDQAILQVILQNYIDNANSSGTVPANNHLEQLLRDDRTYLFAALIDDTVVGYALTYRFPSLYAPENLAYLYDIEVSPSHRRKGVGRLLIETVISHLQQDDVKEIWLGTDVHNIAGQALFNATGAVKEEEIFTEYTYYL